MWKWIDKVLSTPKRPLFKTQWDLAPKKADSVGRQMAWLWVLLSYCLENCSISLDLLSPPVKWGQGAGSHLCHDQPASVHTRQRWWGSARTIRHRCHCHFLLWIQMPSCRVTHCSKGPGPQRGAQGAVRESEHPDQQSKAWAELWEQGHLPFLPLIPIGERIPLLTSHNHSVVLPVFELYVHGAMQATLFLSDLFCLIFWRDLSSTLVSRRNWFFIAV